jgi:tight adherence protein B
MPEGTWIFLGLVFLTIFLLSQGLVVPVFGEGGKMRKRLKQRLATLDAESADDPIASLLREKYLRDLAPWERSLESLPFMHPLRQMIEQAGYKILAYRVVAISTVLTRMPLAGLAAFFAGFAAPLLKIWKARNDRMAQFEEQLPDAIDAMRRALKAGHPFSATLKLVAEDMEDPIAYEFEQTFADINYGNDARPAMLGLLARVPSVTVMALVTSILVQKETGGNIAEILGEISKVIRSRFRFYRRVRTLSAEGRL